ncbi:MAG: DUF6768 family protein [Erythrobacter sp.]
MTDIDGRIRDALDNDDWAFLEGLDQDRGMFQQIGDTWKGPMGGWAKFAFALSVVIGISIAAVVWQVIHTSDPIKHTLWAIAALALLIMQGFLKEWMLNRMNMLTILREVKRLQVQVAILSEDKDKSSKD